MRKDEEKKQGRESSWGRTQGHKHPGLCPQKLQPVWPLTPSPRVPFPSLFLLGFARSGCAPHLFRTNPHPQPSPRQVQPPLWLPTSCTGIQNQLIQRCLSQLRPLLLDRQSWGVTEPGLPLSETALWEESLQPPHWAFLTQPCICPGASSAGSHPFPGVAS